MYTCESISLVSTLFLLLVHISCHYQFKQSMIANKEFIKEIKGLHWFILNIVLLYFAIRSRTILPYQHPLRARGPSQLSWAPPSWRRGQQFGQRERGLNLLRRRGFESSLNLRRWLLRGSFPWGLTQLFRLNPYRLQFRLPWGGWWHQLRLNVYGYIYTWAVVSGKD